MVVCGQPGLVKLQICTLDLVLLESKLLVPVQMPSFHLQMLIDHQSNICITILANITTTEYIVILIHNKNYMTA